VLDAARKRSRGCRVEGDEIGQLALARLLEIVGEAAGKVSPAFRGSVKSRSRATCGIVLPSSRTSRIAPARNSSLKLLRCRRCFVSPAMWDTVTAFRAVSTKPDQAHHLRR